jgi:hypothetical protein
MLQSDGYESALKMSEIFDDKRVQQFYDPNQASGRAIGNAMNSHGEIAWDIYLFFDAGQTWESDPPKPEAWCHQLGGREWADPSRFHTGTSLEDELLHLMTESLEGAKQQ